MNSVTSRLVEMSCAIVRRSIPDVNVYVARHAVSSRRSLTAARQCGAFLFRNGRQLTVMRQRLSNRIGERNQPLGQRQKDMHFRSAPVCYCEHVLCSYCPPDDDIRWRHRSSLVRIEPADRAIEERRKLVPQLAKRFGQHTHAVRRSNSEPVRQPSKRSKGLGETLTIEWLPLAIRPRGRSAKARQTGCRGQHTCIQE